MWDYDKLFAENNIIGILYPDGEIVPTPCKFRTTNNTNILIEYYGNKDLSYDDCKVQYIIRLDEHGNVVERLFDREKDIPEPIPELETGMFVRVPESGLGYVNVEDNRVIYQSGGFDDIDGYDGVYSDIVEVYKTCSFNYCDSDTLIWSKKQ